MTIKRTGKATARTDGTVLSGGAFAATQLDDPAGGLSAGRERTPEELEFMISASARYLREHPEEVGGYDPANAGHNSIYIAGIIKQKYPEAESVVFQEHFTSDVSLRIVRVEGPTGVLALYEDDNELCNLIDENGLNSAAEDVIPYARGAELYLNETNHDVNAVKSEYTMIIDRALDFGNDEALTTRSERGEAIVEHYRSRFDDTDLEPEFVATDALADLAHWAKVNGVDFRELVDRATEYAENEEDELT